jgi:cbb3-type cytochrome oxidase maturation protein
MDILYLLVPLSVLIVMAIIGVLAWSIFGGQFDDLERQGERILQDENPNDPDSQNKRN